MTKEYWEKLKKMKKIPTDEEIDQTNSWKLN